MVFLLDALHVSYLRKDADWSLKIQACFLDAKEIDVV